METFIGTLALFVVTFGLPGIIGIILMCIIIHRLFTWKRRNCPVAFYGWNKSFIKKHQFTQWYHQDHSQPEQYDYEEWEERKCTCCGYTEQREIPYYSELEK